MLLIWNNALPDGAPNQNTLHAARPVIKGTKYVVTKWFRTRKWS
jgi:prolyl 4-hydroxylase